MNNESRTVLQKANFVLLVLIAAALGYLIVRQRSDPHREQSAATTTAAAAPVAVSGSQLNSTEMKSSFAPLRPRVETNTVRGLPPRIVVAPVNITTAGREQLPPETPSGAIKTATAPPQPVAAAFTRRVPDTSTGGASIIGRVALRGAPPPEKTIALDVACGRLHPSPMTTRHYVVSEDGGLANVFVYVKSGVAPQKNKQQNMPVLDNINCEFQPYVLGVRAGQAFSIRNSDSILHSAQFLSRTGAKPAFNMVLPVKGTDAPRVFQKPEVFIQVKCDVHPWMFAYIGVVEHPWFAVSDSNGNFALPPGLPHSRYTIAAAHVKAGESLQEIVVDEGVSATMSFTLDVPDTLAKTERR
ncbi:MAG TPA: hypothetical protein VNT99_10225 [Methylomirabilota bacterium]|nr:hypothetical protein [Methylomirabilota bacterium]